MNISQKTLEHRLKQKPAKKHEFQVYLGFLMGFLGFLCFFEIPFGFWKGFIDFRVFVQIFLGMRDFFSLRFFIEHFTFGIFFWFQIFGKPMCFLQFLKIFLELNCSVRLAPTSQVYCFFTANCETHEPQEKCVKFGPDYPGMSAVNWVRNDGMKLGLVAATLLRHF